MKLLKNEIVPPSLPVKLASWEDECDVWLFTPE